QGPHAVVHGPLGSRSWPANLLRHGIAPASVAITFAARALLAPILHEESAYLLFVPAVLISAGIGGLVSGIVATVLSLVLVCFFLAGFPAITIAEATSAAVFAAIGFGIAWVGEQLQRNRVRAVARNQPALAT